MWLENFWFKLMESSSSILGPVLLWLFHGGIEFKAAIDVPSFMGDYWWNVTCILWLQKTKGILVECNFPSICDGKSPSQFPSQNFCDELFPSQIFRHNCRHKLWQMKLWRSAFRHKLNFSVTIPKIFRHNLTFFFVVQSFLEF